MHNDFTINETTRTDGSPKWQIIYGGSVFSTCRSLKEAKELTKNLNLDCYFLDRKSQSNQRNVK